MNRDNSPRELLVLLFVLLFGIAMLVWALLQQAKKRRRDESAYQETDDRLKSTRRKIRLSPEEIEQIYLWRNKGSLDGLSEQANEEFTLHCLTHRKKKP